LISSHRYWLKDNRNREGLREVPFRSQCRQKILPEILIFFWKSSPLGLSESKNFPSLMEAEFVSLPF